MLAKLRQHLHSTFRPNVAQAESPAQNPVDSSPGLPSGVFREDMRRARQAARMAQDSLAAGLLRGAEALAADTIAAAPGWFRGFHLLGHVLDARGEPGLGAGCHAGALPEAIRQRYFPVDEPTRIASTEFERRELHAAERIDINAPGALEPGPNAMFARSTLDSRPCHVDRLHQASAWQDAHHTLVLDRDDQPVSAHTVGSEPLVRAIRRDLPANPIGPRAFVLGTRGSGNFYHWMIDVLPKLGLCRQAGYRFEAQDRFVVPFYRSRFQLDTLHKLGITESQVYFSQDTSSYFSADELIVPYLRNNMATSMGAWVPQFLQQCFLPPGPSAAPWRKLFVSRDVRHAQGRDVANRDAVHRFFEASGFEVVFPERHGLESQARLFSEARVVAGVHGAGLTNIVYCKPGTTVVEFYGDHVAPCYWAISALLDLRYYHHWCAPASARDEQMFNDVSTLVDRRAAGISIPLDQAEALLQFAGVDR